MHDKSTSASSSGKAKHKEPVAHSYIHNADAPRINTEIVVLQKLEQQYPDKEIIIVPEYSCNLLSYAASGNAVAIPDDDRSVTNSGALKWDMYFPPASRLNGGSGAIATQIFFGKYKYIYKEYEFIVYLIDGRDNSMPYPAVRNYYIIADTANSAKALMLAAGDYGASLHGEIWVFDQGYWQKDPQLWDSVQDASWDNVILDADMKKALIGDVTRFFDGRDTYKRLKVPWKRGIIYHGPPGNGKTISTCVNLWSQAV
jgi:transitional endoplasmic reticulum ATPase